MYIVDTNYRGKGYGLKLFNHALEYLKGRNIGLDAVVEQQANYLKSGFQKHFASHRYKTNGKFPSKPIDSHVASLRDLQPSVVAAYEKSFSGINRPVDFLSKWVNQERGASFAYIDDQSTLSGIGVIRPAVDHLRIGPLYANSHAIAVEILNALVSFDPKTPIVIDVPSNNLEANAFFESIGWTNIFECGRMWTAGLPDGKNDKITGLLSLEVG